MINLQKEEKTGNILISTDKSLLDYDFIHSFLTRSYWAKEITKEKVFTATVNSLAAGIYLDGKQIGFCRVVSDFVRFAYLMDVFIIEEHRGRGYCKMLMNFIMNIEELKSCNWMLATSDAHSLYSQFGFNPLPNPEKIMKKEAGV